MCGGDAEAAPEAGAEGVEAILGPILLLLSSCRTVEINRLARLERRDTASANDLTGVYAAARTLSPPLNSRDIVDKRGTVTKYFVVKMSTHGPLGFTGTNQLSTLLICSFLCIFL